MDRPMSRLTRDPGTVNRASPGPIIHRLGRSSTEIWVRSGSAIVKHGMRGPAVLGRVADITVDLCGGVRWLK